MASIGFWRIGQAAPFPLQLSHSYISDLRISLATPGNSAILLIDQRDSACGGSTSHFSSPPLSFNVDFTTAVTTSSPAPSDNSRPAWPAICPACGKIGERPRRLFLPQYHQWGKTKNNNPGEKNLCASQH